MIHPDTAIVVVLENALPHFYWIYFQPVSQLNGKNLAVLPQRITSESEIDL